MEKKKDGLLIAIIGAIMLLFSGVPSAWGIFRKEVCQEYGFGQEESAFVLNVTVAAFGLGCVIGGYLQDKKGSFLVCLLGSGLLCFAFGAVALFSITNVFLFYLVFCLPAGLGCAFLYPAVMSCIQKANPNKKGLSTGIAGVGFGLSGVMLTLIKMLTITHWGIRGTFLCLSIMIGVLCTIGSFFMKSPATQKIDRKRQGISPKQIFLQKSYYYLTGAVFFTAPAVLLFSPKIVEMARTRGLPEKIAVWIVAFGGILNAIGRFVLPALSDKWGRKTTAVGAVVFLGGISFVFAYAQNWWIFVAYGILCFFYSGASALLPSFCTDLFGTAWAGVNYGLVALGMTAGSLLFPPIVNVLGKEWIAHLIAIVCCGIAAVLYYSIPLKNKVKEKMD